MIVMDEFPVDIMLGADGRIDAVRYPNFAALAATGTWFKNAHTVYDSTTKAIPAVLTGKLPKKGGDATYKGHPRTVFDLFGRRGYRIVKSEEATSLCPPRYCRGARPQRPGDPAAAAAPAGASGSSASSPRSSPASRAST